ncbi:MAG TPA: phenylacetate-CoA oxygenase subunit PaaC [Gemmatimonadaceae bacterium]|nr:phenylacetate-CoA oxygenase subunit PaaC [Gemmatimonadaceae bacterium]
MATASHDDTHDEHADSAADVTSAPLEVAPFNVAGTRGPTFGDPLVEYLLRLGDDRLVLGHRLSEWCGHGPILEEDIAVANFALDLIGQANMFLGLAGQLEGAGRDADALAYFRDATAFRNALLVELPRGDFGVTMVRQFLFDAFSVVQLDALAGCGHSELAAIAAKALKEEKYHLRHSSEWVVRLGDGTEESHRRVQDALNALWRYTGELFERDIIDEAVEAHGIVFDHEAAKARWDAIVHDVLQRATLEVTPVKLMASGGRRGRHTEHLGHLLTEMQSIARAHPGATW